MYNNAMLRRDGKVSVHRQLEDQLLDLIRNNRHAPGDSLGSEVGLARQFAVSRTTVRNVVDRLVARGLLTRVPGKGLFVALPVARENLSLLVGFGEKMRAAGLQFGTTLLEMSVVEAPEQVAQALSLETETEVVCVRRVRYLSNTPFALQIGYLPRAIGEKAIEFDLEKGSLTGILQDFLGLKLSSATETVGARGATAPEARLLGTSSGFPLLIVNGVTYDVSSRPIRYTESMYRSDLVCLQTSHSKTEVLNA